MDKPFRTEKIQIGDYNKYRKFVSILISLYCIILIITSSVASSSAVLIMLVILAVSAFLIIFVIRTRFQHKFNNTALIKYYRDCIDIHIDNTSFIIYYNLVTEANYYPKETHQISSNDIHGESYINRYEVVIKDKNLDVLKLSTPFGKYYSDLRYSGLYDIMNFCRGSMPAAHHKATKTRKPESYDKANDYSYHKILWTDDKITPIQNYIPDQCYSVKNYVFICHKDCLEIKSSENKFLYSVKWNELRKIYIFEKYSRFAKKGKYVVFRLLFNDYSYKDFIIESHESCDKLTFEADYKTISTFETLNGHIERFK